MRVEAISQQPAEREQQEVRRREVAVKSAAACGIDQAGATITASAALAARNSVGCRSARRMVSVATTAGSPQKLITCHVWRRLSPLPSSLVLMFMFAPRILYPAQQDNCFTSLLKVCAASFRPSTMVR